MTENGNGDTEELRFPTTFLEKKKKTTEKAFKVHGTISKEHRKHLPSSFSHYYYY